MNANEKRRLAIIVSHPIQYYVPLYRRLARRSDLEVKVFFTWHGGDRAVLDRGFKQEVAWDIPLTNGYEYEVLPNRSSDPGTHHFMGLRNSGLIARVMAWGPDAVHLTGYAYASHLSAIRAFHKMGVPLFFRGDSHLLDGEAGWRGSLKRALLTQIYRWPAAFLYVGKANREYYKNFGVPESRLYYCPHSIEVARFAEPDAIWEKEASRWRAELGMTDRNKVLLFAGKFEKKKQPIALMRAFLDAGCPESILVMVGNGDLGADVDALWRQYPERFRVLPFQNQSRMPVVYRLGDLMILPSAFGETWGLAVNEALACGRPVLVSDRVGCAEDLVRSGRTGEIFRVGDWTDFTYKLALALKLADTAMRQDLLELSCQFDIESTERHLVEALSEVVKKL